MTCSRRAKALSLQNQQFSLAMSPVYRSTNVVYAVKDNGFNKKHNTIYNGISYLSSTSNCGINTEWKFIPFPSPCTLKCQMFKSWNRVGCMQLRFKFQSSKIFLWKIYILLQSSHAEFSFWQKCSNMQKNNQG